jgi:hypothetical protein
MTESPSGKDGFTLVERDTRGDEEEGEEEGEGVGREDEDIQRYMV